MANKLVKGEAMAVVWHVDNLKVLQKDPFQANKFYQYLLTIYGNKLKLHIVNIHNYIGMDLDYSEAGVGKVPMIKYL